MGEERRKFERETARIPFVYSLDPGNTHLEGEWKEAVTEDIGPVVVGGVAFYTEDDIQPGTPIRIALYMDLETLKAWDPASKDFPPIYHGEVLRVTEDEKGRKVAVVFRDFANEV